MLPLCFCAIIRPEVCRCSAKRRALLLPHLIQAQLFSGEKDSAAAATASLPHSLRRRRRFHHIACVCAQSFNSVLSAPKQMPAGAAVCAEANACCLLVLLSAPKQMPAAVCCWCGASINALSLSLCEWSPLLCCLLLLPLPFWLLSIWVVGVFLSRLLLVWCLYRCSLSLCLSVSGARYFAVCCCYPCPSGFFQYGSLVLPAVAAAC